MSCSIFLNNIFYVFKNICAIIYIVTPILAIVSITFLLLKMTASPEDKKGITKIKNSILALIIIFFIPTIVTAVLNIVGDENEVVACYFNSREIVTPNGNSKYIPIENREKKGLVDPSKYEKGEPKSLNFKCKSKVVKAQFSCETLKIVEKHLYDLNAQNFNEKIRSYGGFDQYAKSLGGIFGKYYGKKMPNKTEADFQRAAEYVLGWMYMYGWDYYSTSGTNIGTHVGWKGNDAFYANGGFVGRYLSDGSGPQYKGPGTNFDGVISTKSQGGNTGRMSSACGDLEIFIFNKLNINRGKQYPKVSRLKDLKVGDCLFFGNGPKWNKLDESNWSSAYGAHNVVVGEVYKDHAVIYDGGSYYPSHNNYKRSIYFPAEDTEAADDAEVKKVFGYTSWGIRRWYKFTK